MTKPIQEDNLVTIRIKVETEIYEKASEVCAAYGLTLEEATVLFFEYVAREGVPKWLVDAAKKFENER